MNREFTVTNLLSGSVHIVVSTNIKGAFRKAKHWFGRNSKIGIIKVSSSIY